jgi:hypothetical protein
MKASKRHRSTYKFEVWSRVSHRAKDDRTQAPTHSERADHISMYLAQPSVRGYRLVLYRLMHTALNVSLNPTVQDSMS